MPWSVAVVLKVEVLLLFSVFIFLPKCSLASDVDIKGQLAHKETACLEETIINTESCTNLNEDKIHIGQTDGKYLPEGSVCELNDNKDGNTTAKVVECIHGKWMSITDSDSNSHHRSKRGIELLIIGLIVGFTVCFIFCRRKSPPPNRNPTISCPTIASPLYTPRSELSILVSWKAPEARDPDGDKVSVVQTQGQLPGTYHGEGIYTVSYMAKDNRGGMDTCSTTFRVIVRRCSIEYSYIWYGKVLCQPPQYINIFGSECRYTCDDGHEISGSSNAQCNENQQWSVVPKPSCQAIACAAPPIVENGKFTGCLGGYPYMSKCILTCETGYVVDRTDTIRCLANRSWTVPGICRDIEPPVLNCGAQKIEVYAGPKLSKVQVQWPPVTAVDNSNFSYPVESDIQSGAFFDIGVTPVTFTAEDKQKNIGRCTKTISVIVKRCPPYEPDEHAYVSCSHSNAYGSVCTSVCNDGYLLVGADSQTCQENKTWNGSKPTCTSRECGSPSYVAYGNYTCLSGTKYKDVCTLNCDPGFQRVTPTTILCTILVEWTQGGYCKDTQPPTFPNGCPRDLEVIASEVGQPTYVNFTLPVAVDNSGDGVIVNSEPVSRAIFALGSTKVTVTATDTQGLQSKCSFFVVVKTISCDAPNIDTSGKNLIGYNCSDQYVFGSSCDLSCMNGNPITGPTQIRCGKVDGNNSVQWKMEGNSRPICELKACSKLRVPKNGSLSCDLLGGGSEICILMCNENYSYPYQDPFQFSCAKSNGTWSPTETTRDCVDRRKVVSVTTDLRFYYYTGTCSTDSADIKDKFVKAVSRSVFSAMCSQDTPCTVDTVSVSCGIIARRRKRDTSSSSTEYTVK
ncbi:sushi, von Willebrand factor type A, EGF and pentraxin domain-containing protein 1-like [Physella acuta]|uniref:sushi, von Willebrand factor type A, EGF and pentraxin domain-containing protein 1-like n=1 Tax=Physella acuta TaxID=109671 RepID=UPI0027DE3EEF|nr:sushi, von Willebrand factor type A, EGF and pentraxin domain-containing protein 1-like [Physella acuta]